MSKFRAGSRRTKGWSAEDAYNKAVELHNHGVSSEDIAERVKRKPGTVEKYIQFHNGITRRGPTIRDRPWLDAEVSTLMQLRSRGLEYNVIAEKLNRTKNSIIGKVFRLRAEGQWPLARKRT